MAKASDFKFGKQLGFAKAHHKITPREKKWEWPWARGAPKILLFHFNIYTMAKAIDFKFGTQFGFAKAHYKKKPHLEEKWAWPLVREAPIYLGFPFNISATATLSS